MPAAPAPIVPEPLAPVGTAPSHAFGNLFPGHSHLFLCDADGSNRIDLSGRQTQADLVAAMREAIARSAAVDTGSVLNELQQVLAQLDRVDAQDAEAIAALNAQLDQKGDKAPRIAALQQRGRELAAERSALLTRVKALGHRSK